jgi:hypothetical protein
MAGMLWDPNGRQIIGAPPAIPAPDLSEQLAAHGLQASRLQDWLFEIAQQPVFRSSMDEDADYYDGNQLDTAILKAMKDRGQMPSIINLIGPTIDVCLGMEAKTRTDWKVRAEAGEANTDVSDALSLKLHEAEVQTRADRACSDAYADLMKVGLGWVYVGSNPDPFDTPYKVERIHRREMFWDWRGRRADTIDWRYQVRKRRLDIDVAIAAFPEIADLLIMAAGAQNRMVWDWPRKGQMLSREWALERGMNQEEFEWFNNIRKTVLAYEVWYRQLVAGYTMRMPNGKVVEWDKANPMHLEAALRGMIQPQPATFHKVRVAFWVGGRLVRDEPSPYKHRYFPYIPFFGYREDKAGVPYGLIRRARSPQDEVNARKTKMLWQLASVRVTADEDAVVDHNQARAQVARPTSYVVLNKDRRPNSVWKVEDGAPLANSQMQVYQDDKETINQVMGVYQAMLGSASDAKSGVGINSLVEQGTTTLAELNDNNQFSRRLVGELLLSLLIEDLARQRNVQVVLDEDMEERVVVLNEEAMDPASGLPMLRNDVSKVNVKCVLDDIPSTPTFRAQQQRDLAELTKSLPPEIQAMIIDFVLEGSDHPKRKEMAERVRQGLGLTGNGQDDPEKAALKQQLQELQQQLQQLQTQPQIRESDAKIDKLESETALNSARLLQLIDDLEDQDEGEPPEPGEGGPAPAKAREAA